MKKAVIAILVSAALGLSACQPPPVDPLKVEVLALETEEQKQAYAMGANVGNFIEAKLTKQQEMGMTHDKSIVVKGFIAAIQKQSQLNPEEIKSLTKAVEAEARRVRVELNKKEGKENKEKGLAFLAENAKRAGIMVTDTGLQYEVLRTSEGEKPTVSDTVKVHYKGTLLDGSEFDSSYSRNAPTTFPLGRVIAGWTEGLQLMNVGSKYKFYIPSDLAYGARSTGKISSHSALIFEVELLEIVETNKPAEK